MLAGKGVWEHQEETINTYQRSRRASRILITLFFDPIEH